MILKAGKVRCQGAMIAERRPAADVQPLLFRSSRSSQGGIIWAAAKE